MNELKDQDIRLIPIIDAGVKVEPGYDVYEEGVKNRYFCQREDGSDLWLLYGREIPIFRMC